MSASQMFFALLIVLFIFKSEHIEGLKFKKRIISGLSARPAQFPWQVVLKTSRRGALHGSGSIIAKNWILTAAHCISDLKSIYVVVGTIFWRNVNSLTIFTSSLYPHPEYNATYCLNDIGLIKLTRPLKYNLYVRPIALVSSADRNNDFFGTRGVISGFGYTHDDVPNPFGDLLHAEVYIISNDECSNAYEENVIESTMCSIGADSSNQAFCEGDSGGPLITRDSHGSPIQIGVISFSAEATCELNHPSAFARVSSFLDFISQTTNISLS